jgi:hypothetical protein
MGPWIKIENMGTLQPESLILFYFPRGNYVWSTVLDKDRILAEYPAITHYCLVLDAPDSE